MTLAEIRAAQADLAREYLAEHDILAVAETLLEALPQLAAVGESAAHVTITLRHFINQVNAFMVSPVEMGQPDALD